MLDECRFVTFWEAYSKLAAMATGSSVPTPLQSLLAGTATAALQKSILQTLALTYKSAKLESVLASLNMTSAEALIALKEPCVDSMSNGVAVTFVGTTADNTKRKRVFFHEGVCYRAIASMMAKVVASTK